MRFFIHTSHPFEIKLLHHSGDGQIKFLKTLLQLRLIKCDGK